MSIENKTSKFSSPTEPLVSGDEKFDYGRIAVCDSGTSSNERVRRMIMVAEKATVADKVNVEDHHRTLVELAGLLGNYENVDYSKCIGNLSDRLIAVPIKSEPVRNFNVTELSTDLVKTVAVDAFKYCNSKLAVAGIVDECQDFFVVHDAGNTDGYVLEGSVLLMSLRSQVARVSRISPGDVKIYAYKPSPMLGAHNDEEFDFILLAEKLSEYAHAHTVDITDNTRDVKYQQGFEYFGGVEVLSYLSIGINLGENGKFSYTPLLNEHGCSFKPSNTNLRLYRDMLFSALAFMDQKYMMVPLNDAPIISEFIMSGDPVTEFVEIIKENQVNALIDNLSYVYSGKKLTGSDVTVHLSTAAPMRGWLTVDGLLLHFHIAYITASEIAFIVGDGKVDSAKPSARLRAVEKALENLTRIVFDRKGVVLLQ